VSPAAAPGPEQLVERLRALRRELLGLHKVLLEAEQRAYERSHGRIESASELLQIALYDPRFAWLRVFSELIVRIDGLLESEEPITAADADPLFREARTVITPSETGTRSERKYHAALQRDPAVVMAHAAVVKALTSP
jgi:hypothetical protein